MKLCPCCGSRYDVRAAKRRVGTMSIGGEVLLLANCNCGSTGALVLVPHPEDVRARVGSDD